MQGPSRLLTMSLPCEEVRVFADAVTGAGEWGNS